MKSQTTKIDNEILSYLGDLLGHLAKYSEPDGIVLKESLVSKLEELTGESIPMGREKNLPDGDVRVDEYDIYKALSKKFSNNTLQTMKEKVFVFWEDYDGQYCNQFDNDGGRNLESNLFVEKIDKLKGDYGNRVLGVISGVGSTSLNSKELK